MNIGKVYNSYIVKKDAPLNERDVKIKAMEKTKAFKARNRFRHIISAKPLE